ncbi:MAG: hypothetical protein JAY63_10770 [Candidatus Thiodiazotropha taylori]|nr:hypothetical protein [Candidatus Thiodiazotropha taylori]
MRNKELRPKDGKPIARFSSKWVLYILPKSSGNGWVNLKLVDTVTQAKSKGYKRTYRLGWNGVRFACSPCAVNLEKREPYLCRRVFEKLLNMSFIGDFIDFDVLIDESKRQMAYIARNIRRKRHNATRDRGGEGGSNF